MFLMKAVMMGAMSADEQTFHLVAGEYFRDCDGQAPYVPPDFEREGFIHCTDGADNVGAAHIVIEVP